VAAAGHGGGGQVPSANVNNMLSPQHQISHFPNHDPAHQASQQRGGSAQYLAPNFHQALPAAQITGQHHHNFHTSQSFPQLHHMGNIGGHSQAATNMLLPVGVDLPQQNIIPPPSVLAHPQPMLNMPLREIKNEGFIKF
jgi:hypothetical protein